MDDDEFVVFYLKNYRNGILEEDYTKEKSNVVDCLDVIIDRLEKENE